MILLVVAKRLFVNSNICFFYEGSPPVEALGQDDPISVGQYTIHGVLGRGGMGIVYLGSHRRQLVAVKVMNPILSLDLKFKMRFRREIEAVKKVSGRFTAKILDHGSDNGRLWYASEYIAGLTLKQAIAISRFSGAAFFILARSMCFALAEIHAARIIHRDLKPSNIILGQDGLKVVDFGVAHVIDEDTITNGALVGTPDYMPPEQFRGQPASTAWDIFALGNLLTFAAVGQPAFGMHSDVAAAAHAILTYVPYKGNMTPEMCAITDLCLEKDPKKRATLSDITALFPTMTQTQVATTTWLPPSVSTKVLACDTKILPNGTLVLPGSQVQRPAAKPTSATPRTPAANPKIVATNPPAVKPGAVTPRTAPRQVAPVTTAKPRSTSSRLAQVVVLGLFLLIIALSVWRVVLLPYQQDHNNSVTPSKQPSVQTSAQPSVQPPLGLPSATFTPSTLGQAYSKSAKQSITIHKAEQINYGLRLTVTINGRSKDDAIVAAKKSCASAPFDQAIAKVGLFEVSDTKDATVSGTMVFTTLLTFTGRILFYAECDRSDSAHFVEIGHNSIKTINVISNDQHIVPVLTAKQKSTGLEIVLPEYSPTPLYCLKTGSTIAEPSNIRFTTENRLPLEVLTFAATTGTLFMECQKDASGKITYTGTGVEIK